MAKKGKGIFLVYVDIDAKHDKEFNDWYNTEHLPELLAVPGILSAARYKAVKGGPKYLAFYELENVGVLRTSAFTDRPRTPWGQRVSPSVIGSSLTRIVGEQIFPDSLEVPDRGYRLAACPCPLKSRRNGTAGITANIFQAIGRYRA